VIDSRRLTALTPSEHVAIAPVHLVPLDCFLAYCLHVSLEKYNKKAATHLRQGYGGQAGLSSRSVLERLSEIQMLDVTIPAADGRELRMKRFTKPEKIHHLLLNQLGFTLPPQPPPEIRNPKPVV